MTETLSVRVDAAVKKRLEALAKRSRRSKSFIAAEAIAAYVQAEEWQLGEIQQGLKELDAGQGVSHERVSTWLRSWGKPGEGKAPRGRLFGRVAPFSTWRKSEVTSPGTIHKPRNGLPLAYWKA